MSFDLARYAACPRGVEPALAAELAALGAREIRPRAGGAAFVADDATVSAALVRLRSATRLLTRVAQGPARDPRDVYELSASVDWLKLLRRGDAFAVEASTRDSCFNHSGYAALVVKDGLVDRLRADVGARPDVDAKNPDLKVKLVVSRDLATLWIDESGESLHKRGWRAAQVKSPLNEALAAGLLLLAGFDGSTAFEDPMCGAGGFVIEAACLALNRAPRLERAFAIERRPGFDARLLEDARRAARALERPQAPFPIAGADRHRGAVQLGRTAAVKAGVDEVVSLDVADCATWAPPFAPGLCCVNPPYGVRLGEGDDLRESWFQLGRYFRRRPGLVAWVLSGEPELTVKIGLKASRRIPVSNGPIDCRFVRYEVLAAADRPGGPRPPSAGDAVPASPQSTPFPEADDADRDAPDDA
ncbi:MAG TPA: THUMP domain-containing protein [Planctomycetota bacterium]|nr:THUMP domain-containing protein [Planctomycetota bacterium]